MSLKSIFSVLSGLLLFTIYSCGEKDPIIGPPATGDFIITIENVFEEKDLFASGSFGVVDSGLTVSYVVNARPGQHLSIAAGMGDFTDLFFSTSDNGMDLYPGGSPLTGNITDKIEIWDAGVSTSTGMTEMEPIAQASSSFFDVEDLIEVRLEHNGTTEFTVTIENITMDLSLFEQVAEGVWAIHEPNQTPFFEEGAFASGALKSLAEFNSNTDMKDFLALNSGLFSALAPGAFALNDSLFYTGVMASPALESLAEDGDPSGFSNVFNTPIGATEAGPLLPGSSYSFEISATEGDFFAFATMLIETNDWFIGANYIPLFHNGLPLKGEITSIMKVWDAGTEVDEFPGVGPNQAPRQSGVDTGATEQDGLVGKELGEEINIPDIYNMVKVTLEAK